MKTNWASKDLWAADLSFIGNEKQFKLNLALESTLDHNMIQFDGQFNEFEKTYFLALFYRQ